MQSDLFLCGWRVRSSLSLPELLPWRGDNRSVDVEILESSIPEPDLPPFFVLPHSRQWANGDCLLELGGVGRFWVEGGRRVLVEPARKATPSDLRVFLLGTVLGVLCHQRGLLPIHASAVRIGNSAVLFAGISGAGKSTLSAALGARGHSLVADDVSAFDPQTASILPAYPQRKLCFDVMKAMEIPQEGLEAVRPGLAKCKIPAFSDFEPDPLPIAAIYMLRSTMIGKEGGLERLSPATSVAHLDKMIYRRAAGKRIQPPRDLFVSLTRLSQAAPVFSLIRHKETSLSRLNELAEMVEAHFLGLKGGK